jgi:type VII secretion-associated protein (TIGR03931 family)
VTDVVVEVGPVTVRGPNQAEPEWVSVGIDGIDDELALIDDSAVVVAEVWRKIMVDVVGGAAESIVVVCPTWWPLSRVERVCNAAGAVADDVIALRRAQLVADRQMWLVEIAPEFVVVWSPGGNVDVVPRGDTDALQARIPMSTLALVDAPEGVEGAGPLAVTIADRLRTNNVEATIADRDWVRRGVDELRSPDETGHLEARPSPKRRGRVTAVAAGTLVSAAVLCGGFAARHNAPAATVDIPMTLLVEGRVGVMVPALWEVQRVTSGPGSARVQVVSPDDATVALHVAQTSLAAQQSHEQMAESLRRVLGEEPDGVFIDFNPSDIRADHAVATYREIRQDRHITWFVLIDRSLRIAVGCQSAPGHDDVVRAVCDQAIRSAHAVF